MNNPNESDSDATEPRSRWCQRLLLISFAILIVYFAVKIGDFAWYRTHIPVGFHDANWSGSWESEQYWITGRLLVRLPDPLPQNEDFDAEALVYYPIHSVWKTGRFVKMDFVGRFDPDSSGSGGRSKNDIPVVGGKIKFKAKMGTQVVEYVAIVDDSRTRMIGSYLSRSPNDMGHFFIRYY